MFDIDLSKITQTLQSTCSNALKDILYKIKPHLSPSKQFKIPRNKTLSYTQHQYQKNNQQILQAKKIRLLTQLKQVQQELKSIKLKKIKQHQYKKLSVISNDQQAFNRANQLITKMNRNRIEQHYSHKQKQLKIYQNIQSQISKIQKMNVVRQQQKQLKRVIIQDRIKKRHDKFVISHSMQKKSNQLIEQIKNSKYNYPNIIKYRNPENVYHSNTSPLKKQYPRGKYGRKIGQKSEHKQSVITNEKSSQRMQDLSNQKIVNKQQNNAFFVTD